MTNSINHLNSSVELNSNSIFLRLVKIEDAKYILSLRMDNKKNQFLSSVENNLGKQIEWLKEYKKKEKLGLEYYFVIMDKSINKPCGAVRLYDFIDDSFCWGSWILSDDAPKFAAIESVLLIYETAFYVMGFNRTHFDVRKDNIGVVKFHKRFGAKITGEDSLNYYFNFSKTDYEEIRVKYKKFLPKKV